MGKGTADVHSNDSIDKIYVSALRSNRQFNCIPMCL